MAQTAPNNNKRKRSQLSDNFSKPPAGAFLQGAANQSPFLSQASPPSRSMFEKSLGFPVTDTMDTDDALIKEEGKEDVKMGKSTEKNTFRLARSNGCERAL